MSERLEGVTLPPRVRGKRSKRGRVEQYPFDEWFDGALWRLRRGEDFEVTPTSLRGTIYAAAKRRRLRVETRIVGGVLLVQRTGELGVAVAETKPPTNGTTSPAKRKGWRFWR